MGSITVWLTSCLTGLNLDSAALLMFKQQICLFGQIQNSQSGGQSYSDSSPYKESECSLPSSFANALSLSLTHDRRNGEKMFKMTEINVEITSVVNFHVFENERNFVIRKIIFIISNGIS